MADQKISDLTEVTGPNPTDMSVVVNAGSTKKVALRNMQRPLAAHVTHSAAQSITSATPTFLAFDTEREDTDVIHDTVTNNSRLTAKTAGIYSISARVEFASNATGYRQIGIALNGTTGLGIATQPAVNGAATVVSMTITYRLAVNDFVQIQVVQNSGGALNVTKQNNWSPEFSMVRLCA